MAHPEGEVTMTIYDYARFYAQSEKAMTDRLNEIVGVGNWMKTKRMLDNAGRDHITDKKVEPPKWAHPEMDDTEGNTVYRGVIFKDATSVNAKLFINPVEAREADDMVLVRSWHNIEIDDEVRYWGIGEKGLPWEVRSEAEALFKKAKAKCLG